MAKLYKDITTAELRQQCRSQKLKRYSRLPKRGLWNLLHPEEAPNQHEDVSGSAELAEMQHKVAAVVAELELKGFSMSGGLVVQRGLYEEMLDPKQIWQASQVDDQDRGGIPDPENYQEATMAVGPIVINGTTKAPPGYVIVRRKGQAMFAYDSIATHQVEILKGLGWTFSLKAGSIRPRQAVAARPANRNGRVKAPEGQMIFARRGNLVTRVGRTADKAGWARKGWKLYLRPCA